MLMLLFADMPAPCLIVVSCQRCRHYLIIATPLRCRFSMPALLSLADYADDAAAMPLRRRHASAFDIMLFSIDSDYDYADIAMPLLPFFAATCFRFRCHAMLMIIDAAD